MLSNSFCAKVDARVVVATARNLHITRNAFRQPALVSVGDYLEFLHGSMSILVMIIAQRERLTRKTADNKEIATREFSERSTRAASGRKERNVSNT